METFVEARDWRQFHHPKDLASAISIEGAELLELFLWKSADEVKASIKRGGVKNKIEEELGPGGSELLPSGHAQG